MSRIIDLPIKENPTLNDWVMIDSSEGSKRVRANVLANLGGPVNSINGQLGDVIIGPDDLDDSVTLKKFVNAQQTTLINMLRTDLGTDVFLRGDGQYSSPTVTDLFFDGNRTVKRSGIPQVNVGTSTLKDFVEKYFFPFVEGTASISISNNIQARGDSFAPVITGSITPNDATVVSREIKDVTNSLVLGNPTGNTINYTAPSIQYNTTYQLTVGYDQGAADTPTASVTFVSPMYYGTGDGTQLGEASIKAMSRIVATQGNTSARTNVSITTSNNRRYFAYPKSYGALKQIIDPNGFDVLASFSGQRYEVAITHTGYAAETYFVYYNADNSSNTEALDFLY